MVVDSVQVAWAEKAEVLEDLMTITHLISPKNPANMGHHINKLTWWALTKFARRTAVEGHPQVSFRANLTLT